MKSKALKYKLFALFALLMVSEAYAQNGTDILARMDANMSSDNRIMESSMTIHGKRGSRTITSRSWGEGTKKSFTEYLTPAAEKGTKMLKLEGQLWIYSPQTDRIIQISGHMLRQSVMGSDLSYEDMMDDRKMSDVYEAKVTGEEQVNGRLCKILELTAKVADVAYAKQKIWVDTERYIPLKQEMYGKSGQLLKNASLSNVRQIEGRWFPCTVVYKDVLKQGQGTELTITKIEFNRKIPEHIFSKASLKQ